MCLSDEHMEPSVWGHPAILLCHNPPCIYARTLRKSLVSGRLQRTAPVARCATRKTVAELLPRRNAGQLRLATLLSDGLPHTPKQCRAAVGCGKDALSTYVSRLRKRGLDIVYRATGSAPAYQLLFTEDTL